MSSFTMWKLMWMHSAIPATLPERPKLECGLLVFQLSNALIGQQTNRILKYQLTQICWAPTYLRLEIEESRQGVPTPRVCRCSALFSIHGATLARPVCRRQRCESLRQAQSYVNSSVPSTSTTMRRTAHFIVIIRPTVRSLDLQIKCK